MHATPYIDIFALRSCSISMLEDVLVGWQHCYAVWYN